MLYYSCIFTIVGEQWQLSLMIAGMEGVIDLEFYHNRPRRPGFLKRLLPCLMLLSLLLAGCGGQEPAVGSADVPAVPAQTEPSVDSFLWGSWMNLGEGPQSYAFSADGNVTITEDGQTRTVPFRYGGGTVTVFDSIELILRVTREEGVTHLRRDALELNLVSEADYPDFIPHEVTITMDNWEEYFEVRFVTHVFAIGDQIRYRAFGWGFALKDEYLDKLPVEQGAVDVDVTIQFDTCYYEVKTPFSLEYEITDNVWPNIPAETGVRDVASVRDRRDPSYKPSPYSDFYGQVMAYLGGDAGFETFPRTFWYRIPSNAEVVAVEGTLLLYN